MCRILIYLSILVSKRLVLLGNNLGASTHAVKKMDASLDVSVLIGQLYWVIVLHVKRVFLK